MLKAYKYIIIETIINNFLSMINENYKIRNNFNEKRNLINEWVINL
jgi:hypothetical protein